MNTTRTIAALLLLGATAHAAPPPGIIYDPNDAIQNWFRDLKVPAGAPFAGTLCCDVADCRPVVSRWAEDHFEVMFQGRWQSVPPEIVKQPYSNPTGEAVLCYYNSRMRCFVPGPAT